MVSKRLVYAMGIDPGGTSGWGVIGVPRSSMFGTAPSCISYFNCDQVTGSYTDQAMKLAKIADYYSEYSPDGQIAIAMETFIPKKTVIDEYYLSALQIIYRIDMMHDIGFITAPLFAQSPDQAMTTAPDRRLKLWGLYEPGPDHIKDGTRHAITFIRRAKASKQLREAAWPGSSARVPRALTAVSSRTASHRSLLAPGNEQPSCRPSTRQRPASIFCVSSTRRATAWRAAGACAHHAGVRRV